MKYVDLFLSFIARNLIYFHWGRNELAVRWNFGPGKKKVVFDITWDRIKWYNWVNLKHCSHLRFDVKFLFFIFYNLWFSCTLWVCFCHHCVGFIWLSLFGVQILFEYVFFTIFCLVNWLRILFLLFPDMPIAATCFHQGTPWIDRTGCLVYIYLYYFHIIACSLLILSRPLIHSWSIQWLWDKYFLFPSVLLTYVCNFEWVVFDYYSRH